MPPLKPVPPLKCLCVDSLASLLTFSFVKSAGGGMSRTAKKLSGGGKTKKSKKLISKPADGILATSGSSQMPRIKQYLGHAIPKDCRQKLFHQVLLQITESMTRYTRGKFGLRVEKLGQALGYSLATLFDSNIIKLDLTPLIHHVIKWVSTCKLNNRDPKETSDIDNVKIENMLIRTFGEHAQKLSCLTMITWPHLVSGEVIRIIGRHCINLRCLELACKCEDSTAMNVVKEDPSVAKRERELVASLGSIYDRSPGDFTGSKPTGCTRLKVLVLPRLDDEDGSLATHIAQALCSLRDLEQVIGVPMLVSLDMLRSQRGHPSKLSLQLLSDIDTYNRRKFPDLAYISDLLPRLNSLELICSEAITRGVTGAFVNARSLKIAQTDFHLNIRQFKNLDYLDINLEFQIAWPILTALSKSRIPLSDLTLRHPTFQMGQEHDGISLKLGSLKSLTLVRSSFLEYNAFRHVASGAPNLTNLSITLTDDRNYTVDEFKDDLVCVLSGLLRNLTSFTAECQYKTNLYNQPNCLLTMTAVDSLLANCPKLRFLGHLDVWNLDDKDVNDLNKRVKDNNWDLQVV